MFGVFTMGESRLVGEECVHLVDKNGMWTKMVVGMFSIPIEFYESFVLIGSLINGGPL